MKQKKQKPRVLSPDKLLELADTLPRGVILSDYLQVMWLLKKEKGMSLREIAAWLTTQLQKPVTHMQVYRVMDGSIPDPSDAKTTEEANECAFERTELNQEIKK